MIQQMADECEALLSRWYHNRPGPTLLVLAGDPGCGKTHAADKCYLAARALAFSAWEAGKRRIPPSVSSCVWSTICRKLEERKQAMDEIIREYVEADFLVIDDIGAETDRYRSGEPVEALRQTLGARERKWTVATTNVSTREWPDKFDVRVQDRLLRNSIIVDLDGVGSYWANK